MPGPRGPRGPMGGPRGPMGGPMGGPVGGPMGGGRTIYVNGRPINNFAPAAGGKSLGPTGGPIDAMVTYSGNIKRNFKYAIKKNGILKGSLVGIHYYLTNGFHSSAFKSRLNSAAKEFAKGKITEQQYAVRRMQAAGAYYKYQHQIGIITDKELSAEMYLFAKNIGVRYEDPNIHYDAPTTGGPSR